MKTKLLVLSIIITLVVVLFTMGAATYLLDQYSMEENRQHVQQAVNGVEIKLAESQQNALHMAQIFASHPGIVEAVSQKNPDAVLSWLNPLLKQAKIDFVTVTDEKGLVIVRTHDSKRGDSVLNQANVKAALGGKELAAIEAGTAVKFSARAGVPVRSSNGQIVGVISAGYNVSNNELVDEMKTMFGTDVTIFQEDVRVATTIIKDNERAVGTKLDPKIADRVLQGESFIGQATILNMNYVTAYKPLIGPDQQIMGVLFAGKKTETAEAAKNQMLLILAGAAVLITLLLLFGTAFLARKWTKPIQELEIAVEELGRGNLTKQAPVMTNDEIGSLARGFNQTIHAMNNLVGNIKESSESLTNASNQLKEHSVKAMQSLDHVAHTITGVAEKTAEQVTGVANVVAATEEMSAGTEEISSNSSVMAEYATKAQSTVTIGVAKVQQAVEQMDHIEATVRDSAQVIAELGSRSTEIRQIVDLITSIANQTNLLALNAAIEAARAGEMGKGFAVVAEEVRKLAEQSEAATLQIAQMIQGIQQDTEKAILTMKSGTEEVQAGQQIIQETGQSFQEIAEMIYQVSTQIQGISDATHQIADGSQNTVSHVRQFEGTSQEIAAQTQIVSKATAEQLALMESMEEAAYHLAQLADDLKEKIRQFQV